MNRFFYSTGIFYFVFKYTLLAQKNFYYRSLQVATGYAHYTYHKNHLTSFTAQMPLLLSFHYAFPLSRRSENKKYLNAGLAFIRQSANFRSYYFYPDSFNHYDGSFPVRYRMNHYSFSALLGIHYEWNNAERFVLTPFFRGTLLFQGPVFYTLQYEQHHKSLSSNGWAYFRNAWAGPYINPIIEMAVGIQYNLLGKNHIRFTLDTGIMFFSAPFHVNKNFMASSLYFNPLIVQLRTGIIF